MDVKPSLRLLDRVRNKIRIKHYSLRTEQAYLDWIKRFILFNGKRHPVELGAGEVEAFLAHLAAVCNVSASTQNQAKSALLFLYREVLKIELPWLDGVETASTPRRLPVVLTREETFQRSMRQAVQDAQICKPATPHTLCHSFAAHLLEPGYDIRTVQELLGHSNVSTTMITTHVLNRGGRGVVSPLDQL